MSFERFNHVMLHVSGCLSMLSLFVAIQKSNVEGVCFSLLLLAVTVLVNLDSSKQ